MTFRQAIAQDLPLLNKISLASKAHWGYPAAWLERWKPDLELSETDLVQHHVLVLEVDGECIGFCVTGEEDAYYEVLHLWVLPAQIGKGYGKQLLRQSLASSIQKDKPIHVTADPNAVPFYERQGFATFDKVESFPPGRFLPIMKRNA